MARLVLALAVAASVLFGTDALISYWFRNNPSALSFAFTDLYGVFALAGGIIVALSPVAGIAFVIWWESRPTGEGQ